MNVLLALLMLALPTLGAAQTHPAQGGPTGRIVSATSADTLLVEAACGQCRLGLPGQGCDLAVRVG